MPRSSIVSTALVGTFLDWVAENRKLAAFLFAGTVFVLRMREYWYASAAMSAMNFWVASASRRARCCDVCGGGGRPARVR